MTQSETSKAATKSACMMWTGVADALPETDDFVLAFIPAMVDFGELDRYVVAYYDGEDWHTSDGEHVRPDYWMEIPAIPGLGMEMEE